MWRFEHRHWTNDLYFLRAAFNLGGQGEITDSIRIEPEGFHIEFWQHRMLAHNKPAVYIPFYINDNAVIIISNVT